MDSDVIPLLVKVFREEIDPTIRSELVRIVSEFRSNTAIPFLKDVLSDPIPEVWQAAIDGLVASGAPDALSALEGIKTDRELYKRRPSAYAKWIEEACEQLEESFRA